MTDRFPTSADLRAAAGNFAAGCTLQTRLLALADALDAGARIVEAGPARTCGGCAGAIPKSCLWIDAPSIREWRAWSLDGNGDPDPDATPCPGFADKGAK